MRSAPAPLSLAPRRPTGPLVRVCNEIVTQLSSNARERQLGSRPGLMASVKNSKSRGDRNMIRFHARRALVAAAALMALAAAQAADISGAGATFPYPIYSKWADAYKQQTGIGLNYQSIGSGGGIKQIKAKTVTFGASDMPLAPKDVTDSGLVQFPTVVGGDVPVVNLDGVKAGALVLDGPTLADIFLGDITQ